MFLPPTVCFFLQLYVPPSPAKKYRVKEQKDVENICEEGPCGDSLELKLQAETSTGHFRALLLPGEGWLLLYGWCQGGDALQG